MKILIYVLISLFSLQSLASEKISRQLFKEFDHMYQTVSNLTPEFEVGGLLYGKKYGDYELLWRLADEPGEYDIIRIYRDYGERLKSFDVSYYRADHIVRGRTVIRRFVGPGISGWRNDTIDAKSGEYLGSQGATRPAMQKRDREILKEWGIELFD